jgi:hypothetical protein
LTVFAVDYSKIHSLAKDTIHQEEGLDAALRSLECALRHHGEIYEHDTEMWKFTQDALYHRREMFYSTRLRMVSVEQRLKNIINMVSLPTHIIYVVVLTLGRYSILEICEIAELCNKIVIS